MRCLYRKWSHLFDGPPLICISERRARPCLLVRQLGWHRPHVSTLFHFRHRLISPLPSCHSIDYRLINLVWRNRPLGLCSQTPSMPSVGAPGDLFGPQADMIPTDSSPIPDTTTPDTCPAEAKEKGEARRKLKTKKLSSAGATQAEDPEKEKRPTKLIAPIYNGLGVAVTICVYHSWLYLVFP